MSVIKCIKFSIYIKKKFIYVNLQSVIDIKLLLKTSSYYHIVNAAVRTTAVQAKRTIY
jgi:hypothetical protein